MSLWDTGFVGTVSQLLAWICHHPQACITFPPLCLVQVSLSTQTISRTKFSLQNKPKYHWLVYKIQAIAT